MKKSLIALVVLGIFASPTFAKKPEWAGEGKPTKEQLEAHKESAKSKGDVDDRIKEYGDEQKDKGKSKVKEHKEKKDKDAHDDEDKTSKGLEKQRMEKAEQIQKEIDKGAETGQDSRETSKKWWKFWGE